MSIQIKPKPKSVQASAQPFELSATPYIGNDLWTDGLNMMHNWMAGYFEIGDVFADFCFAEALNVHRCIADIWLACLKGHGAIECVPIEKIRNSENYAPGFILLRPDPLIEIDLTVPATLRDFDPWTDRSLDAELPDAVFADHFIDKFYDVFVNEHFLYTGYARRRPNGKTFVPVEYMEHPRHANSAKARKISDAPPPIEWRKTIDALCTI